MRVSRWSSGIQLAPRANTGSPLIRRTKAEPNSSARRVQLDRAQADAAVPAVEALLADRELHVGLVERLRAVGDRPPEVGVGDPHLEHCGGASWGHGAGDRRVAHADAQVEGRFHVLQARTLDVDVHRDGRVAAGDGDERADGGQPRGAPALDARRLPEAGGLQVGPPVPAEAARHLADHVQRCRIGAGAAADALRPPARRASARWRSRPRGWSRPSPGRGRRTGRCGACSRCGPPRHRRA